MGKKANRADMQPTWTSLTCKALQEADDFMSFDQLMERTGASYKQMSATLYHLKKERVVDALEGDGRLWWFLTGEDKRTYTQEQRTPEPKGNRTRGSKKTTKPKE